MRRMISIFLCLSVFYSLQFRVQAVGEPSQYGNIKVEYSDKKGSIETLKVMIDGQSQNIFADAEQLGKRLGYKVSVTNNKIIFVNKTVNDIPYGYVCFTAQSTKVERLLGFTMLDNYTAPYMPIINDEGAWVPLEYTLLILNSEMLIIGDTLLISMPQKSITDLFVEIKRNTNRFCFDWGDDFGYTEGTSAAIAANSHLVNVFSGALEFDGASWAQLIQQLAHQGTSYDSKYGEEVATLFVTNSIDELTAMSERVSCLNDVFGGELKSTLEKVSADLDSDVGVLSKKCEELLRQITSDNPSSIQEYNKTYQQLERALDKQGWFSNSGGTIIEVQKDLTSAVKILDVAVKVADVVSYLDEFSNQEEFAVRAIEQYLDADSTSMPEAITDSMYSYIELLKTNFFKYSTTQFIKDNVDEYIIKALSVRDMLSAEANIQLIAWNLASKFVPFIKNGLSATDKFELALYASIIQNCSYRNYSNYCAKTLFNKDGYTVENLYMLANYCYVYLKSCVITRDAAIGSIENLRHDKVQPLIDYQIGINADIATYMAIIKTARTDNSHYIYGFLPEDNQEYLQSYSCEKLICLVDSEIDYTCYIPILQEILNDYNDSYGEYLLYSLYDFSSDGIKELIVKIGTCEADYTWNIYTICNNEVVYIDSFSAGHSSLYQCSTGGVYNFMAHMGHERIYCVTLNDGNKLDEQLIYEREIGTNEDYSPPNSEKLDCVYITDYSLF